MVYAFHVQGQRFFNLVYHTIELLVTAAFLKLASLTEPPRLHFRIAAYYLVR